MDAQNDCVFKVRIPKGTTKRSATAAIHWEYTFFVQECYLQAHMDYTAELKQKTGRDAFKMKVATTCEKEPPESLDLEELI